MKLEKDMPRAIVILTSFFFVVGGMILHPSLVSAENFFCSITPFSQAIIAGESTTYKVGVTPERANKAVELFLGDLPWGATGSFLEQGPVVTPWEFSLTVETVRNAQVGSFSLAILYAFEGQPSLDPLCQYSLKILVPPPLPTTSIPTPTTPLEGEGETVLETETIQPPGEEEPSLTEPQAPGAETEAPSEIEQRGELSFDSRGSKVVELQALLALDPSLYPEGLVTGWYGPLTTSAVQRFQERVGITPTGKVDAATQEKLDELQTQEISLFSFQSYLILEVTGSSVVILQNLLKQLGFFPKDIDSTGYFGPITETAVGQYQESQGIETTGTVGPITRAALNQE